MLINHCTIFPNFAHSEETNDSSIYPTGDAVITTQFIAIHLVCFIFYRLHRRQMKTWFYFRFFFSALQFWHM